MLAGVTPNESAADLFGEYQRAKRSLRKISTCLKGNKSNETKFKELQELQKHLYKKKNTTVEKVKSGDSLSIQNAQPSVNTTI